MPASHRGAVALAAFALSVAAACGADDGGAAEAGPGTSVDEGPVAATAVVVGDCLNGIVIGAAERREIRSADVVACDRPHALEVYATFDLAPADFELDDGAGYPGRARVVRAADEGCTERIESLLEDPDVFGVIALWPSETSWAAGDRAVACAVFSPEGATFEQRQL